MEASLEPLPKCNQILLDSSIYEIWTLVFLRKESNEYCLLWFQVVWRWFCRQNTLVQLFVYFWLLCNFEHSLHFQQFHYSLFNAFSTFFVMSAWFFFSTRMKKRPRKCVTRFFWYNVIVLLGLKDISKGNFHVTLPKPKIMVTLYQIRKNIVDIKATDRWLLESKHDDVKNTEQQVKNYGG